MDLGILLKDNYMIQEVHLGLNPVSFGSVSNTPIATTPAHMLCKTMSRRICEPGFPYIKGVLMLAFNHNHDCRKHKDGFFVTSRGTSGTMDCSTGRLKEWSVSSTQPPAACLVQNK